MRVLAGGPTRETGSEVFRLHREGLEAQGSERFRLDLRHDVVPDPGGVRWDGGKVERVGRVRQSFMEEGGYDGLWLVDSDVIVGPGVLERLWAVDAPVVYGVFWTVWEGFSEPLPQVWDVHDYGFTEECLKALFRGGEVEVYGGGACTLIRGEGFRSRYWPLLRGLERSGGMWGGEDRTFCLGCEVLGVRQVAVSGLPIVHLHDDHSDAAVLAAREGVGL